MLGLVILIATSAISFAAGYGAREIVSRRRRTSYLKYKPYVAPASRQVPTFLLQAAEERRSASLVREQ